MQYNILDGAEWHVNTAEGSIPLDFPDLYGLMNYDNGPMVSLSGSDILVIDFDFGLRVHLDRIEYKYETPYAVPSDVASGIEFSYRNEDFDDYISLSTYNTEGNIYYATTSGTVFAPRYVRFRHVIADTLNASTLSGIAYGFKAFNDDTTVDFGLDGASSFTPIEIVREDIPEVRAIPIYNSGQVRADAYVNLEPTYAGIDEAISISASESGPWTYVFNPSDLVADVTDFSYGSFDTLGTDANILRLEGADLTNGGFVTNKEFGTYTTKVFKRGDSDYNRFVIDRSSTSQGSITVDKGDPVDTIEIRSNNTKPKDYLVVVEFYSIFGNTYYYYYAYRDKWVPSTITKSSSPEFLFEGWRYSRYKEHTITVDQLNENYAGCVATFYNGDSRSDSILYLFRNNIRTGEHKYKMLARKDDYSSRVDYSWYETKLDYSSGMWVYFRCTVYNSGDFVDNSGNYLAYFDSNLNNQFKYMTLNKEIENISNNYYNKKLWYTNPGLNSILMVSHDGFVEVNYSDENYTDDLGGIACLPDGNLLYANGKHIHRLHNTGYPMPEYTIEDVAGDKIVYLALDVTSENAAWALDGTSVGLFYFDGENKGTWDFKVSISFPIKFDVVGPGIWVKCAGESGDSGIVMRYVSKINRRIEYEYVPPEERCSPGLHYQDYTHEYYTEKMPLASDNIWADLPWRKINLKGYLASEDDYFQMRTTLRRQDAVNRYPNTNVRAELDYIIEDRFDQGSTTPYASMWSDWLNYPNLDRVHVDTASSALVMEPSAGSSYDAYISTQNRLVVGIDPATSKLEIRIGYTFASGDGVITGLNEDVYIYAYNAENPTGAFMLARLRIDDTPTVTNSSNIYVYGGNTWLDADFTANDQYYSGEFAFYCTSSNYYASVRKDTSSSWLTLQATRSQPGNYLFFKIVHTRTSSPLKINYVTFPYGIVYVYTDTPRITSFNKQRLIKISDVYPNSTKNVYLRSYVPKDLVVDPETELNMKVRWRVPVY